MDESDPIEARTQRLHTLQTTNPIAWAICQGYRGPTTISKFLDLPLDQVQTELNRLLKQKQVKRKKYYRGYTYTPISTELKRLSRRAYALNHPR